MAPKRGRAPATRKSTARFKTDDGYVEFDANDFENADEAKEENLFDDDGLDDDDDDDDELGDELDDDSSEEEDSEEEEEEEEEEEDELEESDSEDGGLLRWGRSEQYGGDTADLEIGQEVEDAAEEEALGETLRRRQLESLEASDFAIDDDDNEVAPQRSSETSSGIYGAMMAALNGDEETVASPQLQPLQEKMAAVSAELAGLPRTVEDQAARVFVVAKEQLLTAVLSNLNFSALLAAEGKDPTRHPVVTRLVSLDKRLKALETFATKVVLPEPTSPPQEKKKKKKTKKVPRRPPVVDEEEQKDDDDDDDEDALLERLPDVATGTAVDERLVRAAKRAARDLRKKATRSTTPAGDVEVPFATDRTDDDDDLEEDEDDYDEVEEDDDDELEETETMDDEGMSSDEAKFLKLYEAQEKKAQEKKTAKKEKYTVPERYGAWDADVAAPDVSDGRRAAPKEIIENRGLAPHRPKANRNPRLKRRLMYRKAVIRRKGQVRDTVPQGTDKVNYGGEVTGIRAKISRSRHVVSPNK